MRHCPVYSHNPINFGTINMKLISMFKGTATIVCAAVALSAVSFTNAFAQSIDLPDLQNLSEKLSLRIDSVADSPVPGLKQINTDRGLFYISDNGEFFLQARVYNVTEGIVDETENALKDVRLEGMARFADSAIEFKAKQEKYVINVFTDTTCGYCRKLHNEMQELNDLGITVRYLAWPRAGLNSQVYRDTVSIWCSKNPQKAMTEAKAGAQVASASCENKVAQQYNFGKSIGVNGTPNIMLPNGSVIPGYQPAQAIAQALKDAS